MQEKWKEMEKLRIKYILEEMKQQKGKLLKKILPYGMSKDKQTTGTTTNTLYGHIMVTIPLYRTKAPTQSK